MLTENRSRIVLGLAAVALAIFVFSGTSARAAGAESPEKLHLPKGFTEAEFLKSDDSEECKGQLCSHLRSSLQAKQLAKKKLPPPVGTPNVDITHCVLEVSIDTGTKTLDGSTTFSVTCLGDGIDEFKVDLRDEMTVPSVEVNASSASYTRADHQITVTLDATYNTSESFTVEVFYNGTPPNPNGFNSFNWNSHNGDTAFATGSEPWDAHTWWPCVETTTDKFTMNLDLSVPKGMVMASNGVLNSVDTSGGSEDVYHWEVLNPIATYLVFLAATNYEIHSDTFTYSGGTMPVDIYYFPETGLAAAQTTATGLVDMLEVFSAPDVYGLYPFANEKCGVVQWKIPWAMEHQTLSGQGGINAGNTTVHEVAHQWWGDMVTCATWADIWLNEGFAVFSVGLYKEKRAGGTYQDFVDYMYTKIPKSGGTPDFSGSVYLADPTDIDAMFSGRLVYNKGGWVVRMLRWVLGDEDFFDTLAAYRLAYEGSAATTDDLKEVAETVSGMELDWFFDQWVYGSDAPSYRTGWEAHESGGEYKALVCIEQFQTIYPLFKMPLELEVTTGSGTTKHKVWQEEKIQWYALNADGPVTDVALENEWHTLQYALDAADYIEPLKIISTVPALGTELAENALLDTVEITFNRDVDCSVSDFSVVGSNSGSKSFTVSNLGVLVILSIIDATPSSEDWTITVLDSVTSADWEESLDGEITQPSSPGSLPSGDGVPGGDAVFTISTSVHMPLAGLVGLGLLAGACVLGGASVLRRKK